MDNFDKGRKVCCKVHYITRAQQQLRWATVATIDMGRKEGDCCALSRELGPRLVQCGLGRRLLPYQVASSSIQPFGTLNMGQKLGGVAMPSFLGVYLGPHPSQIMSPWPMAYLHTKCHLSPSSRLATGNIGRKLEDYAPLGEGEKGHRLTQCRVGPDVLPYQIAS